MEESVQLTDTGKNVSTPVSQLDFNERAQIFIDFQKRYAQIKFYTLITGLFGVLGSIFTIMYMFSSDVLLLYLFFIMFITAGMISFILLYVLQRVIPLGARLDNVAIPQKALMYFDLFPRNEKNNVLYDFLTRMLYIIRLPPKFDKETMELEVIDFTNDKDSFKKRIKKNDIEYEFDILVRQTPYEGSGHHLVLTFIIIELVLLFWSGVFISGGNPNGLAGTYEIVLFDVVFSLSLIGYIFYLTYSQGYIIVKFFDKAITADDVRTLFSAFKKVLEPDKQNFISVVITGKIEQDLLNDIRKIKTRYTNSMIMVVEQNPEQFQLVWAG